MIGPTFAGMALSLQDNICHHFRPPLITEFGVLCDPDGTPTGQNSRHVTSQPLPLPWTWLGLSPCDFLANSIHVRTDSFHPGLLKFFVHQNFAWISQAAIICPSPTLVTNHELIMVFVAPVPWLLFFEYLQSNVSRTPSNKVLSKILIGRQPSILSATNLLSIIWCRSSSTPLPLQSGAEVPGPRPKPVLALLLTLHLLSHPSFRNPDLTSVSRLLIISYISAMSIISFTSRIACLISVLMSMLKLPTDSLILVKPEFRFMVNSVSTTIHLSLAAALVSFTWESVDPLWAPWLLLPVHVQTFVFRFMVGWSWRAPRLPILSSDCFVACPVACDHTIIFFISVALNMSTWSALRLPFVFPSTKVTTSASSVRTCIVKLSC